MRERHQGPGDRGETGDAGARSRPPAVVRGTIPDGARGLLSIDSLGGLIAGTLTLLLAPILTAWYGWPTGFAVFIGSANLAYGTYSGLLLLRVRRTRRLAPAPLILLVVANSAWAGHCLTQVVWLSGTASVFGLAHLMGEALFVGTLAVLEARLLQRTSGLGLSTRTGGRGRT